MQEVTRQEHKFLLTARDAALLAKRLSLFMREDAYSGGRGYPVRSLYFDTLENRDFHEKNNGEDPRRKLRLRLYDPLSDVVKLEMKQKYATEQKKRSLPLRREDAALLARGVYSPLLGYPGDFAGECYAMLCMNGYRPVCVVEYNRRAFVARENDIRVTFDSGIRSSESNLDLFNTSPNLNPVFNSGLVILEVKYNGFVLSYIQDLLNMVNRSRLSASKYCLGRGASLHYQF